MHLLTVLVHIVFRIDFSGRVRLVSQSFISLCWERLWIWIRHMERHGLRCLAATVTRGVWWSQNGKILLLYRVDQRTAELTSGDWSNISWWHYQAIIISETLPAEGASLPNKLSDLEHKPDVLPISQLMPQLCHYFFHDNVNSLRIWFANFRNRM